MLPFKSLLYIVGYTKLYVWQICANFLLGDIEKVKINIT